MADDVVALIKELGLKKPHLIGISMGGTIAQSVASRYGDQISKLVIHVSCPKWRQAMLDGLGSLLRLRELGLEFEEVFRATLPWIFGQRVLEDENCIQEIKKFILDNPYPQTLEGQKRQFEVLRNFDGRDSLSLIQSQTLISYAREDLLVLPYEVEWMKSQLPHARSHEWEGGHGLFFDFPEQLAERFTEFFLEQ